ncbi:conserved exported protein of unknown function [Nitrospira japonica]|uniref:Nuclear transport factor 2 family protein n=1 Tax=Nitrospira japonica TaxID=1325564 RepID=A0A1W1I108_9BACT|nr:hypothetical protein [Nitrospira japonica]SLM46671.1 conserved exported protein of unknown function [Nitrospira japonica]
MISTHIRYVIICALAAVLAAAGCGGKTAQYPEDHERYLRIDKAIESLRSAYVKKDASGMASLMVPTDQLELLQRDAENDFEAFHHIALEFRVERIMIEGDDIDVHVHWQGVWKKDAEDPGQRQRGHTRLQWVGTKSVLLRGVQGDSPFGMSQRQAGADSIVPSKR